jgi:hypothetical protein
MNRSLLISSVFSVAALALPASASANSNATASDGVQRVAIEGFRGPQAQRIQGAVETGLVGKYYVVPDFSVEEVARRKGVGLVLEKEFAEVGKALDVRAFVSAQIQQKKAGWQVRLLVRRGDTGAPVGKILVADRRLDRLERQLGQKTTRRIEALLARAPSSAVEPPPVDGELRAEADDAAELDAAGKAQAGALFEVSADGRVFSRSFSYAQNLSGLPEYKLSSAYSGALQVAFHPGVLLDGGARKALAPVGITAALEYGLGVSSRSAANDQRLSSDVHGWSVGMQYRWQLGPHALAGQAGYSTRSFTTGDDAATAPDVRYGVVSVGTAARAELPRGFGLLARVAYLHALTAGPLTSEGRFARATVRGMELEGALAYGLVDEVEVRILGGLRRMGWDMNAVPGDAWVAGGAVDQSMWGGLGLAYRPKN